jgi:uncharacterized protein
LGALSGGEGGDHGERLCERDFYREIWETPEFPSLDDEKLLADIESALGDLLAARCEASKSWYKIGETDVPIAAAPGGKTKPLSLCSTIVGNMKPTRLTRLYVFNENRPEAKRRMQPLGIQ